MIITHAIKPSVDIMSGDIMLHEAIDDQFARFDPSTRRSFFVRVVQTRDQAIRECLIKLGWTPPPEPAIPSGAANPRGTGAAAGEACEAKAERVADFDSKGAAQFMLNHLARVGRASSEQLVDACRGAGYRPHDDRAFGPIIARLAKAQRIRQVGECRRQRGNGTSGGRIWGLLLDPR